MDFFTIQAMFTFVVSIVATQSMPDILQGVLNPGNLLKSPQQEVMDSLTSVGLGNDIIDQPAKKLLLHVYDQLQRGESVQETVSKRGKKKLNAADTIRSLTSQVPNYEGRGRVKLTFNLTSLSPNELANHAELHIRPLRHEQNTRHRLKVTIRGDQGRKGEKMTVRVASKSKSYYGYIVFDITDVIQKVIDRTNNDQQRLLDVTVIHRAHKQERQRSVHRTDRRSLERKDIKSNIAYNALRSLAANPKNLKGDDGLLVVYTQDKQFIANFKEHVNNAVKDLQVKKSHAERHLKSSESQSNEHSDIKSRSKRDADDKSRESSKRKQRSKTHECEKQDMFVDFIDLGWNRWILYPPRYNAHICGGKCTSPVGWGSDPTNHAILQSLMRLQDKRIPRPCCVPTRLQAITMLYYENDEIVVRHHEGMAVSQCGCR